MKLRIDEPTAEEISFKLEILQACMLIKESGRACIPPKDLGWLDSYNSYTVCDVISLFKHDEREVLEYINDNDLNRKTLGYPSEEVDMEIDYSESMVTLIVQREIVKVLKLIKNKIIDSDKFVGHMKNLICDGWYPNYYGAGFAEIKIADDYSGILLYGQDPCIDICEFTVNFIDMLDYCDKVLEEYKQ